jgi:hypothetical protein
VKSVLMASRLAAQFPTHELADKRLAPLLFCLAFAGAIGSMGCPATAAPPRARVIIVTTPPPAPIIEELTPQPFPSSIWIAGYWHWTGVQYAWIPGHWESSPRVGAQWRAPRYVKSEGAYIYEPGTWWNSPQNPLQTPGAGAPPDGLQPGGSGASNVNASAFH